MGKRLNARGAHIGFVVAVAVAALAVGNSPASAYGTPLYIWSINNVGGVDGYQCAGLENNIPTPSGSYIYNSALTWGKKNAFCATTGLDQAGGCGRSTSCTGGTRAALNGDCAAGLTRP